MVVQLDYRPPTVTTQEGKSNEAAQSKSVFLGWTGMQSQAKLAPIVGRGGIRQEQDVATVEIDATFARTLGIADGTKVELFRSRMRI